MGTIPHKIRKLLIRRKNNIVAYELLIAVAALVSFCPALLHSADIDLFMDNQSALSCVIKGASRKPDLSDISGRLWFECCHLMANFKVHFVGSKLNLADAPSRGDESTLQQLGFSQVPFRLPSFSGGLNSWLFEPSLPDRLHV